MGKIKKVFGLVKKYGFRTTFGVVKNRLSQRPAAQKKKIQLLINSSMDKNKLENERQHTFEYEPTISILVPLYNTEVGMLKSVIESVVKQTYSKWQLCLCDGGDGVDCKEYLTDSRIVYKKLPENFGISGNTNACAELATGEYLGLLDHDDVLHPSALYSVVRELNKEKADFIYTDEATFKGDISNILTVNFKPDFAPDTLRANNYICHFSVFTKELFVKAGGFRSEYDGSQDHDLFLRMTGMTKRIKHIPEILYFWRAHKNSVVENVAVKQYAVDAGKNAVKDYMNSLEIPCEVDSTEVYPSIYKVSYKMQKRGKISIIIPNKNNCEVLKRCIDSIFASTYDDFEIIIVENNSDETSVFEYYEELKSNPKIKVVIHNIEFNYSKLNNLGVNEACGEYLLFLNNDTQVINKSWLEEMLMFAQRDDVGAVGARLFYPNNTLQHCFLITGIGEHGVAVHAGLGLAMDDYGYLDRIGFNQNVNAVTGACLMVATDKYKRVGGFDENLPVAYNDVDFCLKLRKEDLLNVYTPFATLYHYESFTRGRDTDEALSNAADYMKKKWGDVLIDPYYNSNFSTEKQYVLK